ncbi:hypothetical protein RclHR1_08490010 [Rhizophagus clarus]|uniref:Uncharacterized protein n=1 Tax=Rhizophagus clarus TaxID=94130 RepID=A0A2Z6S139_9GLOM|nr:hypothetical protein RclHR1_08490010 [Rhizophagus clarus]GES84352.1 hypothetical protein GLOIN_2v1512587 [Rhizophagus clarus]
MSADHRKHIAVFVSSEGSVPRRMECKYWQCFCAPENSITSYIRSSWSRAKPVMESVTLIRKNQWSIWLEERCEKII